MVSPTRLKKNISRANKLRANYGSVPYSGRVRLNNLAGKHFGGQRDLYEVMGYPRELSAEDYFDVYERQDIAVRIVDAYPDATWREAPTPIGDENFKTQFKALCDRLNLLRSLHRLDRLMCLGHYGVLLLGLDGGEPTHTPAVGSDYRLMYVQPHSERTAQITKWDNDPNSPRYGLPEMYQIRTGVSWTGVGGGERSLAVHWSRVIHVAERPLEDVSIGTPVLRPVFNRLMDLDKLLGGSAEMYWQNVAMLLAFMADADVEWDPDEAQQMKDQLEEMQNGLRRMLRLRGVEAQNLAPGLQGADPTGHIDKQIDMIAGTTGIPKRIMLGNEAGELASTQDETNWQGRVAERREQVATPIFLDQLSSRLIKLGVLSGEFTGFEWPESDTLGERGRAEVADMVASAVQKYTGAPGAEFVLSPEEFRELLGYAKMAVESDSMDQLPEDAREILGEFRKATPLRAIGDERV